MLALTCFEKKLSRTKYKRGMWRIRTNREITSIFGTETIIGTISKLGGWARHVVRMTYIELDKTTKKALEIRYQSDRKTTNRWWIDGEEGVQN